MARPKYIDALHEAKYELRFSSEQGKAERLQRYNEALANAARECGFPGPQVERAVAADFVTWMKQEKLSKPSQK